MIYYKKPKNHLPLCNGYMPRFRNGTYHLPPAIRETAYHLPPGGKKNG